jgi:predicted peptidase
MKKLISFFIVLVLFFGGMAAVQAESHNYYNRVDKVFDWGTSTTKVIVNLGETISNEMVDWNSFEVYVRRSDPRLEDSFLEEGQRKIEAAYVSDSKGEKLDSGEFLTLELEVGPGLSLDSALNYVSDQGGNNWIDANYTISQLKDIETEAGTLSGIKITELNKIFRPQIEKFVTGSSFYNDSINGDINLTYAAYEPEVKDMTKKPLIVWLHGGGEGGTDPTIPLAANKSVNFASEEIQDIYGGAYVLVPQTPTRWMHPGANEGDFEHLPPDSGENGRPYTSKYTKALMNLIDNYVKSNMGIDRDRIYVGGCSNGGFMTVRLGIDYPDYFAALYPVCHGMTYDYLTDRDINKLVDQNIWFVSAATDSILPAPSYTIPLYDRLIKEGAQNVHLSYPEKVIDTSGKYVTENGKPYEYNGHWSWIYVYNNDLSNEINGKTTYLQNWLAKQELDD